MPFFPGLFDGHRRKTPRHVAAQFWRRGLLQPAHLQSWNRRRPVESAGTRARAQSLGLRANSADQGRKRIPAAAAAREFRRYRYSLFVVDDFAGRRTRMKRWWGFLLLATGRASIREGICHSV